MERLIYIRRDDLNRWIAKNRVLSQEEIEEYADTHMEKVLKGVYKLKLKIMMDITTLGNQRIDQKTFEQAIKAHQA
jgi:hypothetical protein